MANAAIQDGAALGVARALGVEDNVCLMHDNDKVGSSAVGNLVRTKNKKEINPFPEGQDLLKRGVLYRRPHFCMLRGGNKPFLTVCSQFIIMAVPTGYQHQNRDEILIFYFKIFSGVTVMSPGYVLDPFWVLFGYAFGTHAPTLSR